MPKMKTKKALRKRFRKTASGKLKHTGACRSHLFTGRTRKNKRQLRKGSILFKGDEKRLAHLI